ncbi:MAG: hypothetical protein RLZZ303_3256 [Candidatus Hydrogenedentota bacterium]|jgi:hypothetical protein
MFIAVYTVFLALASGLSGAYVHALLAAQGYVSNSDSAIALTMGVAGLFAGSQLGFMAILQLVAPTRGAAPLLTEAVSNAMALVLLPYILRIPLPWPHPKLAEFDMLVLAAVFLTLHGACKLLSLFAALHARPATRLVVLFWATASVAAGTLGMREAREFADSLISARQAETVASQVYEVDQVFAEARPIGEGALLRIPLEGRTGKPLLLHFAAPSTANDPPEKVFIAVDINGASNTPYLAPLALNPTGWTSFEVPPEQFPADATHCDLIWMREEESSWMTRTRIRPAVYGGGELLVAGPWPVEQRSSTSPRSIVLIVADGFAASHSMLAEYSRKTTPSLEAWSDRALRATQCMTPAPETPAALMTLLTGQSPLRHGYLNGTRAAGAAALPTLAESLSTQGYLCAAFTEGASSAGPQSAPNDIVHGTGFERGFHLFDQRFPMAPAVQVDGKAVPGSFVPAGSSETLERARQFISSHKDTPFFVLIRLRELAYPRIVAEKTPGFIAQADNPKDLDVYDAALAHFDSQLGEFLTWLDQNQSPDATAVAIVGTYGYDFTGGERGVYLTEPSLNVPLIVRADPAKARIQRVPCSLEDVTPTLAGIAGVKLSSLPGLDLFGTVTSREPISMTGDPLALSLRTRNWRMTWQSGRDPFSKEAAGEEAYIEFINIDDLQRGRPQGNNWSRESELATRFRQRLLDYLNGQQLAIADEAIP